MEDSIKLLSHRVILQHTIEKIGPTAMPAGAGTCNKIPGAPHYFVGHSDPPLSPNPSTLALENWLSKSSPGDVCDHSLRPCMLLTDTLSAERGISPGASESDSQPLKPTSAPGGEAVLNKGKKKNLLVNKKFGKSPAQVAALTDTVSGGSAWAHALA